MIRTVGSNRIALPSRAFTNALAAAEQNESPNLGIGIASESWEANGIWVLSNVPQISGIEFTPLAADTRTGSYSIWASIDTFIGTTANYSFIRLCSFTVTAQTAVSTAGGSLRYCSVGTFTNDTGKDGLAFVVGPANQRSIVVDGFDYDRLVIQGTVSAGTCAGLYRQLNS
jgi:hypothetical protein